LNGGFPLYPNRLSFLDNKNDVNPNILSSRLSPIQKFRCVHFPFNPELPGLFTYRISPVFMDATGKLSYGDFQQAAIRLEAEAYPGILNVTFTRGFVASQGDCEKLPNSHKYEVHLILVSLPKERRHNRGCLPFCPN